MIVPRIKVSSFDPRYMIIMRLLYQLDKDTMIANSCPFNEYGIPYLLYADTDFWIRRDINNLKAHIHVSNYFKPDTYREKVLDIRMHGKDRQAVYKYILTSLDSISNYMEGDDQYEEKDKNVKRKDEKNDKY